MVKLKSYLAIGAGARRKVLSQHTAAHRAQELESYAQELMTLSGTRDESKKRESVEV